MRKMLFYFRAANRVFHLSSNCKAESCRKHVENQLGSKRALEGVGLKPKKTSTFIVFAAKICTTQKGFQKQ